MSSSEDFLHNCDRFTAVVDATDDWTAQSPCEEWTATDVLDHVVDTHRTFLTERGAVLSDKASGDGAEVWHAHLGDVRRLLADREFATKAFDGWLGPAVVEDFLAGFFGFDLLVHRWDLGRSTGQDVRYTEAEIATLHRWIDQLGDMFYGSGASKPPLDVPDDAPPQTTVLARMGRAG